jgi:DNA-binding XRE family transcriptional regulator
MRMISTISNHVSLLLRVARLRAGREQGELAQHLGVSQPTVSRW